MLLTLAFILGVWKIDPRKQTVEEKSERVLIHIENSALRLLPNLLIVLDVVEIDAFDSVTKIVLIYVSIASQTERNGKGLRLFETKILEV